MAPKSCKNDVKINAEIEVGQKFEKYQKKCTLGSFPGDTFSTKSAQKQYLKFSLKSMPEKYRKMMPKGRKNVPIWLPKSMKNPPTLGSGVLDLA